MQVQIETVSRALRDARAIGLTLKQLAGQLHLGHSARQPLRHALRQLLGQGHATFDGHRYRFKPVADQSKPAAQEPAREERRSAGRVTRQQAALPAAMVEGQRQRKGNGARPHGAGRFVTGILHLKPEGYGFVSPLLGGSGRQDDVFIPPRRNRGALDGDVVLVSVSRGRDGRFVGEVVEVVERRRQLVLGVYRAQAKATWVEPQDRAFSDPIPVPRDPRAKDGDLVKVRLVRDAGGPLRGEIVAHLGSRRDPRFEILATAYAEGFSDELDPATLLAAQGIPDHVRPEDAAGRRDLRTLPLVTIDGEDARDFDDAVHVSRVGNGFRLVVAIADVAHYVKQGGALDREALRRGTSVYFPSMVLPMLPERLSNGICSLNPDVDRLCMVADMALDAEGRPLHAETYEAVMRSHARLTYTKVAAALEGQPDADVRPLLGDLRVAHELSRKLTERRRERGSIDFDLPEAKIVLAEDGTVAEIVQRPRNDAHRLVEEFMLAANEAVARFFDVRGLPTVYRIHDQPDEEKLDAFAQLARLHGFELPEHPTPGQLNELLEKLQGTPQQKALNALLLRAMMQAQYSPENIGHFGLAAPTYLHFTSPIRRYPDLMVHRLLKEHWARAGSPMRPNEREEQEAYLAGVAAQCSERERAAMKAERDIDAYFAALFMVDKVGEEYDAVVAAVTDFGLFCELKDVYVEGLIPKEKLGDSVELDEEHHRLVVGKSGRSYGVGDELRVRVVESDPSRRRITLEPASAPRSGSWLTPGDLATGLATTSKQKPRRRDQRAQQPAGRPPRRESSPARPPRRKRRRGGGR
jgi:ribonuclease R